MPRTIKLCPGYTQEAPLVTFFLYLCLPRRLELFSPSSHRHLRSTRCYSTSIQSSLARINSIIAISIRLSTRIRSDCLYHTGISLILTLLSCSTSIEPWDESTLAPTTTNCLTWAPTYRSAPPPSYYLHRHLASLDEEAKRGALEWIHQAKVEALAKKPTRTPEELVSPCYHSYLDIFLEKATSQFPL